MAFGNGKSKKTHLRRSFEIGRIDLGVAAGAAPHPLSVIRKDALTLAAAMTDAVWDDDPLAPPPGGRDLHRALLRVQSGSALNSVWAEGSRFLVASAVREQAKRRRNHLFGLLRNAAANLPADAVADLGEDGVADLIRDLDATPDADLLPRARTLGERGVIALARISSEKFSRPDRGRPDAAITLTLDHRSLRCRGRDGYVRMMSDLTAALRSGRAAGAVLEIAAPRPRGPAIPVPIAMVPAAAARAARGRPLSEITVDAVCVVIGEEEAVVKAVISAERLAAPGTARFLAGRDYGYRNTVAITVIDLGREMPLAAVRALAASVTTKEEARAYLSSRQAPEGARVVETRLFPGAGFQRSLAGIGAEIDALRSQIDTNYNRLEWLRAGYLAAAGLPEGALVPEVCPEGVPDPARRAHARFFRLLGVIIRMREKRRGLYRRADGVKRSWLGFVSNREAEIAARHRAAVVCEDLTVIAEERGSPEYKGRAFNRLINNGSKGRYGRAAAAKLEWAGTPLIAVPSYYTSVTDHRSGVVDRSQRRGDVFVAKTDGAAWHADLHAAETIALWGFLVPAPEKTTVKKPSTLPGASETPGPGSLVL